ncbi:hypothetical protein TRFO_10012 [Tritrichomonas foetus]|uniref:Uncharacterized protein n=1 Tax=Tritrichomonas foetus TaxID=1144522 RepID=A0A1J4JFW6_9EUKA|nr:hypothetical protein TRFO_10012 [Tritrichomonas foetus]|eukprot:OHS96357.1 hypothetical protein TRFO_10012 [Tritrichomonas foetus]
MEGPISNEEMDSFLNVARHLSTDYEDYLRSFYGFPQDVPVNGKVEPLVTLETAICGAGEYVLHMQSKGYFKLNEPANSPVDVYKKTIYAKKMKEIIDKPRSDLSIKLPTKSEPFQRFWLSSNIVVKTVIEIRDLIFHDQYDQYEIEQKFVDRVASITRIMKHEGKLNESRQTRQQLYATMKYFILQVNKIRKELLETYIKSQKIVISQLNEQQLSEFNSIIPIETSNQVTTRENKSEFTNKMKLDEVDADFFINANKMMNKLPKLYHFSNFCLNDKSIKKTEKDISKYISTANATLTNEMNNKPHISFKNDSDININESNFNVQRPNTNQRRSRINVITSPIIKKTNLSTKSKCTKRDGGLHDTLPKNEINHLFWQNSDPLELKRKGEHVDQLNIISSFSSSIDLDKEHFAIDEEEITLPFRTFNNINIVSQNSRMDSMRFVTNSPNVTSSNGLLDNIEEEEESITASLPKIPISNYQFGTNRDDISFLNDQNVEVVSDDSGTEIHQRLDTIWGNLGFSIFQKLDMVVKYSQDSEISNKLSEALSSWEKAWEYVQQYNSQYKELKEYLVFHSTSVDALTTASEMFHGVKTAEKSLNQISDQLHRTYEDDLTYRKKSIPILIADRRIKIRYLCSNAGLNYDDILIDQNAT